MSNDPKEIDPNYERHTYKENDRFIIEYEIFQGNMYVHVDTVGSVGDIKALKKEWPYFVELAKRMGLDKIYSYTNNLKFAKMIKEYEYLGHTGKIDGTDGVSYHVIAWSI